MTRNLIDIDSAMNMIKEEIIRDLSASVAKQAKLRSVNQVSASEISFSENIPD